MPTVLSLSSVTKIYKSGQTALHEIDLVIEKGEIFALLGPNGAGKTTLISIICGLVSMTTGHVSVNGYDIIKDYRSARAIIGLVPQEISLDIFTTVEDTVRFSRGLFGKPNAPDYIEQLLRDLSLWEKRSARLNELSGGMKRRVMIAKALSHEPDILFLDEPTAGVDVNLRRDMWDLVRRLRDRGVTIILTTHYIEEAEEMADRVGVIDRGRLMLIEGTATLMHKLGKRRLTILLHQPLMTIPPALAHWPLQLDAEGSRLVYEFDANASDTSIPHLLRDIGAAGIDYTDLETSRSTLEDIFVGLLEGQI
ncbi:ABC transporter ATP-binding protein [Acidocella aminolytica]|uniref:ABC transporter ATP-binding protein n=1 Tax=Acidocella aminolytica TaxID=33998 RepID=UPI0006624DA9|nr:ABC transporter ATP-binding protein [Acidocella aminolytica]SHF10728.1 ABC-2 type transport system ATP-binding protein [Acidocella aminolytica 101 = DSM 11237]